MTADRPGPWIQTYTGRRVYPMDFKPDDFHISDIAHSLSNICRYNGHTSTFYSVAEHSFHVANEAKRRGATPAVVLQALLHDAAETYIGDMVQPLKRSDLFVNFARIEDEILGRIFLTLDLPETLDPMVKEIDHEILSIEGELLMGNTNGWDLRTPGLGFKPEIRCVPPTVMHEVFVKFYQATQRRRAELRLLT